MSDSVHEQLAEAAAIAIRGLDLAGNPPVHVLDLPLPEKPHVPATPAILVAPYGVEQIDANAGTNSRDDVGYPLFVGIAKATNQQMNAGRDQRMLWRERIIKLFQHGGLTISRTNHIVIRQTVETSDITNWGAWFQSNLWLSTFVVRVTVRQPRGVAA